MYTPIDAKAMSGAWGTGVGAFGFDIIFSPNGNVVGQWTDIDKIILFVRDYTDQDVKTGGSPAPGFPDSLPGWRLNNSWDATTRATVADWTPAKGPDNGDFPTTVNGCDVQRFLVRWRAHDDQARIEARWINAAGIPGQSVSGHVGWLPSVW